jgi:DNA processing protein
MNKEELVYLSAFKKIEHVGDSTIDKIYNKFHSFKGAWNADDIKIRELNLQKNILESLLENRNNIGISSVENEIEDILSREVKIGSKFNGKNYPERLRELKDAPPLVYIKGNMKPTDEYALAIVGTRKPSETGKEVARKAARELAKSGYTIISGLARGTDTQAHMGALEANGRTIAVLGTGFNKEVLYPKENLWLFNKIVKNGFCISEFPPYAKGLGYRMYRRNRIISILSKGVLIIETSDRTRGTIAQARYAKNQGKKIFVMDSIDKISENNEGWRILKEEIKPIIVQSYEDILDYIERPSEKQISLLQYDISIKSGT